MPLKLLSDEDGLHLIMSDKFGVGSHVYTLDDDNGETYRLHCALVEHFQKIGEKKE